MKSCAPIGVVFMRFFHVRLQPTEQVIVGGGGRKARWIPQKLPQSRPAFLAAFLKVCLTLLGSEFPILTLRKSLMVPPGEWQVITQDLDWRDLPSQTCVSIFVMQESLSPASSHLPVAYVLDMTLFPVNSAGI